MIKTSLGDLAYSYSMQHRNSALKQEMQRLTTELASGQVADVKDVLAGNYSYLGELEHSMETLNGFDVATAEAQLFTSSMQSALERMTEMNERLSSDLVFAGNSALGVAAGDPSREALETARAMIDVMNTSSAGRSLFAGIATDTRPVASVDDLMNGVRTAIAGAATVDDMIAAAENWATDPGGFAATMYQGSDTAVAPFHLSEQDFVPVDIKASDAVFGKLLAAAALSAIAEESATGLTNGEQSYLHGKTGQTMLGLQTELIAVRGGVGFAEGRMDEIATRNAVERNSLSYAKQALLEIDPFEAATRLEEVQFQLQALYAVTAKSSQLSLVNYI